MIITHKYNGKIYTLSNENLQNGDKVYSISWGRSDSKNFTYKHEYFDWRSIMSGWISEPHTIKDIHYSNYKPEEVHTDHGFGPKESYFKIIDVQSIKSQAPTGTIEAMAFALTYKMKKHKKPVKFKYYNERKLK